MDRMKTLKALAHGEEIEKGANLADIVDIGMTALMLHNNLHGRAADDDGPDFDKSDMDGLMGALNKSVDDLPPESTKQTLLQMLKAAITGKTTGDAPVEDSADTKQFQSTPMSGEKIAKSIDEDRGLVTAVILRPDVTDLHGDIYSADEVEKACFNFNTRCRQTNVQHLKMADFDMVQSFVAPADFVLGEGEVRKGDWIGTMFIDPSKHEDTWKSVKSGEFTGFSIGCKASTEIL